MTKWQEVKLGDLGEVVTGKTPSTKVDAYWCGDIPFITPKDIQSSKHIFETERYLSNEGMLSVKGSILPKNAICVSCIGNIGYVSMTTKQSISNQQINSIIANDENDANFVYYLMKSLWPYFKNYEGQSTTLSILNKSQFSKIDVCIPKNKDIQKKIAGVLGALDDKIELNNKINNNLGQQAQTLFKSWFIDFEPFGGTMPEDWKVGKLEELVDFTNGYAFKSNELENTPISGRDYYDVFKQGHIMRGGGLNLTGTKSYYPKDKSEKLGKYVLKKGDILMAMTDMKGNVAILGNTALMNIDDKYILNQRVGLLRCNNEYEISYPYVYILTNSFDFLKDLRNRANSGVQVNLSSSEIKNSDVIIPSRKINQTFNEIGVAIFEKIFANQRENTRLAAIRDALLPKLMSGEIDVSNVDISALTSTDKLSFR